MRFTTVDRFRVGGITPMGNKGRVQHRLQSQLQPSPLPSGQAEQRRRSRLMTTTHVRSWTTKNYDVGAEGARIVWGQDQNRINTFLLRLSSEMAWVPWMWPLGLNTRAPSTPKVVFSAGGQGAVGKSVGAQTTPTPTLSMDIQTALEPTSLLCRLRLVTNTRVCS